MIKNQLIFFFIQLRLKIDFGRFYLYGIDENQSDRRLLVESLSKSSNPMMNLEFELFPMDKKNTDYRFKWIFQPLIVIYDAVRLILKCQLINDSDLNDLFRKCLIVLLNVFHC